MRKMVVLAVAFALVVTAGQVALAVTPFPGVSPTSSIITINDSPGQQNDAHVSGDLASYTDQAGFPQIRYYNFATGVDSGIPNTLSVAGGTWIWAPGITGTTAPAGLAQFFFSKKITLSAPPTEAWIKVAADNFAEVRVNGVVVGSTGSADPPDIDASKHPLQFNILSELTVGENTISIRGQNGTDGGCTPCTYQQNPAGVVFGGSITADGSPVKFASDTSWQVFDADPSLAGATPLGSAQNVCPYSSFPGCPAGSTIFGSDPGGSGLWWATWGIAFDVLSDVSGPNVVFTRQADGTGRIMVYNTNTSTLTEVDPAASPQRLGSVIGGNTVAYVDISSSGDIVAWDLATSTRQVVSAAPAIEQNPNVSPDGNVIVWEYCLASISNCDAYQAVKSGGSWVVSPTANTATPEGNPDTDGTTVVFDADRAGSPTGPDIYYRAVSGGPETQISLPGVQRNPGISKGIVSFESVDPITLNADVYVYVIATNTLMQITDSPNDNETLNDLTVLGNGDVRVVWAANDVDIVGTTFTPPRPRIAVAPASVDFGDVNVGATGSTIVTVSNVGGAPLTVSGVAIAPTGGPFGVTTPVLPATIVPGATLDVPVSFSPTVTGVRAGTLSITNNDAGAATAQVTLTGRGVVSQPPPSQQIADILTFFDNSVKAGTLTGSGPGNSAKGRLGALRNMIESAGDLIRRGLVADACGQLADVRDRIDGQPQPPDFVTGPAAVELRQRIEALRATLGCP